MADVYGIPAENFILRFLRHKSGPIGANPFDMVVVAGDGTGINPDPSVFGYTATGWPVDIYEVRVHIFDATPTLEKFGGLAELTNGCKFEIVDSVTGAVQLDLTGNHTITKNADLTHLSGVNFDLWTGVGLDLVTATITAPFGLRLPRGYRVQWTNQDDLTGLTEFHISFTGHLIVFED